jgi:DUF2892 family protein
VSRYFPHNMGALDRGLRAFVIAPAAIVAAVAISVPSIAGIVLLAVAAIALATAASGICPSYVPFGIDTHSRAHRALLPH